MWDGLVIKDKENLSYFDSNQNIIVPAHIKNLCIDNAILNALIGLLHKYSYQEKMSNIEKFILLSLGLLGESMRVKSRNYSFVMAMSSIESLLEKENERSIKNNVSIRCARIVSDENNFKETVYKFKEFYRKRSEISHGEVVYISERKLSEIISNAIYILFYFVKELPRIEETYGNADFHEYFDDILPKKGNY
ncbi:hypothetical protein FD690_00260 [Apilactobacillus kunkeei]|uniref:HEPN domain-containing protein n=1 Tax=Apilactobacillus kunkeei TaxID=148814 RepID=UPI00110CF829|nr:HEPN domain-containing protein [Apilactobacillus kunkeei]TMT03082.1 hypothetical protein FD690_00260 [Apilactobacillus kunkeei]